MKLKRTDAIIQDIIILIFTALKRVIYLKMEAVCSTETSVHFNKTRLYISATCLPQLHLYVQCIHLLLLVTLTLILLIHASGIEYANLVSH
jgi:hypothetical protein